LASKNARPGAARGWAIATMLALALAACARATPGLDVARVEALRASLDRAGGEAGANASSAGEPSPTPLPGRPPTNATERLARARAAWTAPRPLPEVVPAGPGSRYAFAVELASPGAGAARDRLYLFDLAPNPGVIVGEHEFGPDELGTAGEAAGAPVRVTATFEVMSDAAEPLVLAEIEGRGRVVACGWWFERRRSRLVCAPSIGGASHYRLVDRRLFEIWEADLPGDGGVSGVAGTSGRSLHLVGGRWREEEPFRCLGWKLEDALREAGSQGIANWQTRGVQQRVAAATRAAEELDLATARSLLRDAVAIDGCATTSWRLLGRLEFDNGDAAAAAPALALAIALKPREPAAALDLADALAVLQTGNPTGSASFHRTVETLHHAEATARIVERGARRGARGVAVAFYQAYLDATVGDPRLDTQRRHAVEQIAALGPLASPSPARRRGR
jgi:hypothetical protein